MTLITNSPLQKLNLSQFVRQLPDEEARYELVNGEIVRILPTRRHETIAEFISDLFKAEVRGNQQNYWVSGRIIIKTETSNSIEQGRNPDVSVVNRNIWESNPFAYSALIEPLQLAVEVVSTNWEDDYLDKLDEYQRLGIREYWIVDYLAIASRSYLGNPKVPTVFVYLLDDYGLYQVKAYTGQETIVSKNFPRLHITTEQILNV